MPNEEMGSRTLPQPPDVATGVVMIAVAGFLGFRRLSHGRAVLLPEDRRARRVPASESNITFPEPALQKKPQDDLRRFELEQRDGAFGLWLGRSLEGHRTDTDR